MARLAVLPDTRSSTERSEALRAARESPQARALLGEVVAAFDAALPLALVADGDPRLWDALDGAYGALDAYLAHLVDTAGLDVRCAQRCSACCTDAPPTLPVEGLRLVRALRQAGRAGPRFRRAVDYARRFQAMLLARAGESSSSAGDTSSEAYRMTQLEWRTLGLPCPVLDDDGNCGAHSERPLACRVHVSVEDPAHCAPSHPRFLAAERPPLWGDPREAEVEQRLLAISRALGLPATPNIPWALAALHDHPLGRQRQ